MNYILLGLLGLFLGRKAFSHGGDHKIHSSLKLETGDKKGILLVHFGTSNERARSLALDKIKSHIEEDFSDYRVREAFTSRMVIKKIENQINERVDTPLEALEKMRKDGITHVIVQATHVINGIEAEYLKAEVEEYKDKFKDLRMGTPILTTPEDYMEVADIFHKKYKDENIVLVGHGTPHHSTSSYGMLQSIITRRGYHNMFVGTVEGYPGLKEIKEDLYARKIKDITLVPLMVVAGVHAHEDIAGEWKEELEKEGYNVRVSMEGMGEIGEVQHILIHHIEDAIHHVEDDIRLKKINILKGKIAG